MDCDSEREIITVLDSSSEEGSVAAEPMEVAGAAAAAAASDAGGEDGYTYSDDDGGEGEEEGGESSDGALYTYDYTQDSDADDEGDDGAAVEGQEGPSPPPAAARTSSGSGGGGVAQLRGGLAQARALLSSSLNGGGSGGGGGASGAAAAPVAAIARPPPPPPAPVPLVRRLQVDHHKAASDVADYAPVELEVDATWNQTVKLSFVHREHKYDFKFHTSHNDPTRLSKVELLKIHTPAELEAAASAHAMGRRPGPAPPAAAQQDAAAPGAGEGAEGTLWALPPGFSSNTGDAAVLQRLMDRFLPPLIEADGDVGRFEGLLRDSLQALYHSRCALLGTAATNQAQEAEIRLDAERVRKRFEAVVPKRNLVKRLLAGMALIIDSKYRFCLNCGRHDTPEERGAFGETAVSDRPMVCHAQLCGFILTTQRPVYHAAEETIRNGPAVTDFLLETVGSAASLDVQRFKDLFSYCPEDYILGIDNSDNPRYDYTSLRADLISLSQRVNWHKLSEALRLDGGRRKRERAKAKKEEEEEEDEEAARKAQKLEGDKKQDVKEAAEGKGGQAGAEEAEEEDEEDVEPEGLLERFFDTQFPEKGEQGGRFYRLYWWVLKAYGTSFRPVPPQRLTEYYQERMAHLGRLAGGDEGAGQRHAIAGLAALVQKYKSAIEKEGSNLALMEVVNDRRPRKLEFERLVKQGVTRNAGSFFSSEKFTLGMSFHGAHKHKWHSIIQHGVLVLSNTKHMSTGAAYGAGIFTSPELGTSLGYAGHSYGHHGSGSNRLSPNGGAVAVVEYASSDGQTSFIRSANPHVVLSESRAVCVRFLLVPRKDGDGEGK